MKNKTIKPPKTLSKIMDTNQTEDDISLFATQANNSNTNNSHHINNELNDDIEEFMLTSQIHGAVEDEDKEGVKQKYIDVTLKQLEHDRQLQTLEKHHETKTIPVGLRIQIRSTVSLSDDLKKEWDATMHSCSNTLLHILSNHHRDAIKAHKNQRDTLKKEFTEVQIKEINKCVIEQHNTNISSRKRRHQPQQNREEYRPAKTIPYYQHNKQLPPQLPRQTPDLTYKSKNYQPRQPKPNW